MISIAVPKLENLKLPDNEAESGDVLLLNEENNEYEDNMPCLVTVGKCFNIRMLEENNFEMIPIQELAGTVDEKFSLEQTTIPFGVSDDVIMSLPKAPAHSLCQNSFEGFMGLC
jgi:hypothetical protein